MEVLECTHSSSEVNTQVGYAEGLDESCQTRSLFINYAQRTGESYTSIHSTVHSDAIV